VSIVFIDLQTAADQLGVHYQTAYKWVRSGQLPADLVCNKYLVDPAEVEAFAALRQQPALRTVRKPRLGFANVSKDFTGALLEGDANRATAMISGLASDGVPLTVAIEEVIAPALRDIGTAWHNGEVSIWQEHRGTAIVERILGEHNPNPRGRRRGNVAVASLEGDLHGLPALMAAAALREVNWHVHLLGANLPAIELVDFCQQQSPDLVVVTVSMPDREEHVASVVTQVESLGIRILVGRPGGSLLELQQLAKSS
jgi:excisionase family DNA binding protein